MLSRILGGTIVLACAVSVPTLAFAQAQTVDTAVTFNIPVNLTNLSPDIERVRVGCMIQSPALTIPSAIGNAMASPEKLPGDETYVVLGTVQATMQVVFPIQTGWLNDPVGKSAHYLCGLLGFSKSQQRWQVFGAGQTGAFQLTPPPPALEGDFTW